MILCVTMAFDRVIFRYQECLRPNLKYHLNVMIFIHQFDIKIIISRGDTFPRWPSECLIMKWMVKETQLPSRWTRSCFRFPFRSIYPIHTVPGKGMSHPIINIITFKQIHNKIQYNAGQFIWLISIFSFSFFQLNIHRHQHDAWECVKYTYLCNEKNTISL